MALKTLLLARGAFNLLFGVALLGLSHVQTLHGTTRGGFYAVADGVLALLLAAALWRSPARWLAPLALAEALVRLVLGALILGNPGMERMVVGATVFYTAVIFVCITLGVLGLFYVLLGRRREGQARVMVWPAAAIAGLTLLLGLGLGFGILEEQRRELLAAYAILLGLTLALAGHRLRAAA